jgi:SAM-dependent methyltransferase
VGFPSPACPGILGRMNRLTLLQRVRKSLRQRGLLGTAAHTLSTLWRLLPGGQPWTTPAALEWDRTHGVETAAHVPLHRLTVPAQTARYGTHYEPISPTCFRRVLDCLTISHEEFVFLDLGSGKGRALLLAAGYPFQRVVGVEFARELHEQALANFRSYTGPRRCGRLESLHADATAILFPPEPTIVFLHNPFAAEILNAVLVNLRRSLEARPRPVYLLYFYPVAAHALESAPFLRLLRSNDNFRVYANVQAELAAAA